MSLIVTAWATTTRLLPWLCEGQQQLDDNPHYGKKTIKKLGKLYERAPYFALVFALTAAGVQHVMFHIDGALNLDFNLATTTATTTTRGNNNTVHTSNGTNAIPGLQVCVRVGIIDFEGQEAQNHLTRDISRSHNFN